MLRFYLKKDDIQIYDIISIISTGRTFMKIITPYGEIDIHMSVLKCLVYQALIESYGLVRMDDPNIINKYLAGDDKGIHIKEDKGIFVDVFPVISYGMNIDQVSRNAQENIIYKFKEMLGVVPQNVNIHVQGIKVD